MVIESEKTLLLHKWLIKPLSGPFLHKFGHPKLLRDLSHVALARHEVLSHPSQPFRFAQIVAAVNRMSEEIDASKIVKFFFQNNQNAVTHYINSILIA